MFQIVNKVRTRRPNPALVLRNIIDQLTPEMQRKFQVVLNGLLESVTLRELATAIQISPQAAIDAINLEQFDAFIREQQVVITGRKAYEQSINAAADALPSAVSSELSFTLVNPESTIFIEQYDFNLIREVGGTTKEAVRRVTLEAFQEGGSPIQQARRIKDSIGLTRSQGKLIQNFRAQLEQQTNRPDGRSLTSANNRRLTLPDKRLATQQVLNGGMSQTQIDQLVERYQKRLISLRAETIARTETARASSAGQQNLWNQAESQGLLDKDKVRRMWIFTPDELVRESHVQITSLNPDGVGLNEMFVTPFGPVFSNPAEPNCRCSVILSFRK